MTSYAPLDDSRYNIPAIPQPNIHTKEPSKKDLLPPEVEKVTIPKDVDIWKSSESKSKKAPAVSDSEVFDKLFAASSTALVFSLASQGTNCNLATYREWDKSKK